MKLLIAGAKSKFFHLTEFSNSLQKFGIEGKVINDIEVYTGFPSTNISNWFQTQKKFKELINSFKPDAVFLDNQSHFGLATIKAEIPLYMHLRGDYWSEMRWAAQTIYRKPHKRFALWWKRKVGERCFNNSEKIFPICNYLREIVKKRYPKKTVEVLYQGINTARWYKDKPMDLKHPCVGLLQDANIWGKAKEMLTLAKVLDKMSDVNFYWVGDGPYKQDILSVLERYQNFKWLGRLEYPDKVRQYLSAVDVYALVSGIDMAPLTLLEAQLMRRPIIATSVGGIPELMIHNKTGYLVEKGDHARWVERLECLLNDKEKSRQMGDEGRKFVEQNFDWQIIAKRFADMVKDNIS